MSKFLKLTNFVLNTNDIHKIIIQPNKYCIHIASKKWMVLLGVLLDLE